MMVYAFYSKGKIWSENNNHETVYTYIHTNILLRSKREEWDVQGVFKILGFFRGAQAKLRRWWRKYSCARTSSCPRTAKPPQLRHCLYFCTTKLRQYLYFCSTKRSPEPAPDMHSNRYSLSLSHTHTHTPHTHLCGRSVGAGVVIGSRYVNEALRYWCMRP